MSAVFLLLALQSMPAQAAEDAAQQIAQERSALAQEREGIEARFAQSLRDCWQRFAVNACLREVRLAQREALEPVRMQELALNARERQLRSAERTQRLQSRQDRQP